MAKSKKKAGGKEPKKKKAKKSKAKKSKAKTGKGKLKVYDVKGKAKGSISLPRIFEEPLRPEVINRDVTAARANRRQPYGANPRAGMRHATSSVGKGRGMSRVPRLQDGRTARLAPNVVGGRRAFPPTTLKKWSKKMNKKERRLARRSALAALANPELVKERGHRFDPDISLPLVVEDDLEKVSKTSEVLKILDALGVHADIERAKKGTKIRAGRGKMRGRRKKRPKSLLIIVKEKRGIERGIKNIPGVDISTVEQLNTEIMAPGGMPGRLSIFSESAMKELGKA